MTFALEQPKVVFLQLFVDQPRYGNVPLMWLTGIIPLAFADIDRGIRKQIDVVGVVEVQRRKKRGLYTWVDTSWLAALSHPSGTLLNMLLVQTLRFPAKCSPGAHRRLSEVFFMCAVLYNAALESGGAHTRGGGSTTPESPCLQS